MATNGMKLIYGAAGQQPDEKGEVAAVISNLKLLTELGIDHLDSAQLYQRSEEALGKANAGDNFTIDTKTAGGFMPGTSTKEGVLEHGKSALEKLKIKQLDVYYIHAPDKSIPFENTLDGINELYKLGAFRRFGLSNFEPSDVRKVYDIAKEKGYVLPSVYQGNYNAVARTQETDLFPVLRELKIAFFAYSPIAGGFLAKSVEQLETAAGRWEKGTMLGDMYRTLYDKPEFNKGLEQWGEIAEKEGISKAELAYRWIVHHSGLKAELGDAVIFGATNQKQIQETIKSLKSGPLSSESVKKIEDIWQLIKHVAPVDNYNSVMKKA